MISLVFDKSVTDGPTDDPREGPTDGPTADGRTDGHTLLQIEVASWENFFSMLGNEKINFPMLEKREKREKTRIYHVALTRP